MKKEHKFAHFQVIPEGADRRLTKRLEKELKKQIKEAIDETSLDFSLHEATSIRFLTWVKAAMNPYVSFKERDGRFGLTFMLFADVDEDFVVHVTLSELLRSARFVNDEADLESQLRLAQVLRKAADSLERRARNGQKRR